MSRMISESTFRLDTGPPRDPKEETNLWKEFKTHFRNVKRKLVVGDHRDFMSASIDVHEQHRASSQRETLLGCQWDTPEAI